MDMDQRVFEGAFIVVRGALGQKKVSRQVCCSYMTIPNPNLGSHMDICEKQGLVNDMSQKKQVIKKKKSLGPDFMSQTMAAKVNYKGPLNELRTNPFIEEIVALKILSSSFKPPAKTRFQLGVERDGRCRRNKSPPPTRTMQG
ncbi:hypothetical protein RND71_001857 [Anisodus tanguticus]|uniref:Uncharacterized protein n=1 Tax=Anisodus tanguticus TaxID=243964 RepID=A0AAE1T0X9_9SOLA|nr:hypothetical protein RND71_001857 [Anisodus tanguticus]